MSRTGRHREYALKLATISGDPFQEGILILLQQTYSDVQRIPTKPTGDGGLDGLSHGWSKGYCCYGLDLQGSAKTTPDDLRIKVVRKFRDDLQLLFELDSTKNGYIHKENTRLRDILTGGQKLTHIQLITNYLEDNRIIGDLMDSFKKYKIESKCRYVEPACTMSIWGPDDICNNLTIDDAAMLRIDNPSLATVISEVENTAPHALPPLDAPTKTLDEKMAALKGDNTEYKSQLLEDWGRYLLFMQKLNTTLPNLHRNLETLVKRISHRANMESHSGNHSASPVDLIEKIEKYIEDESKALLSQFVSVGDISAFKVRTIARLIGVCPLDWRKGIGT